MPLSPFGRTSAAPRFSSTRLRVTDAYGAVFEPCRRGFQTSCEKHGALRVHERAMVGEARTVKRRETAQSNQALVRAMIQRRL